MKKTAVILLIISAAAIFGCAKKIPYAPDADTKGHTAPTAVTAALNENVLDELSFSDQQSFVEAQKGLIATDIDLRVQSGDGSVIWDQTAYGFVEGEAPSSVNPSLWRQAKLNRIHGLFKVTDHVYQLRGFCLSNMTIIEGETGWIIVDPLTTRETSSAAIAFARKHLDEKPIVAIIFTHTHIDHFGGVFGLMSAEEAAKQGVRIIAPKGFMAEATSENVIAGVGMGRRAAYQFGKSLAPGERGHVDDGLGKTVPFGTYGILPPTEIVGTTPRDMVIDGVNFIFQYAPESEAPAEITFYLPDMKAWCGAEIVSRNMHNLYTLRGAKVRDALKWSGYIDEAIHLFGDAEVYFGCHHWPIWGNEDILDFLKKQRDLYKYIHDQTVRLANAGYTPREISETIKLPASLRNYWSNRGYYGTLKHNSKAVYQAYFGWYDGNPANLDPLPPENSATRYIAYMGGADRVLEKAQASFDDGDYRWVAEVLNHLVFAEPDNSEAKALLARTYDQLGYQAESGVWRNVYLTGAYELRHGAPDRGVDIASMYEVLKQTPLSRLFDSMAVRLDGPAAEGKRFVVNVIFTDINESYVLTLENSVLHHRQTDPAPDANATLKLTHELFLKMAIGKAGIRDTVFSDDLETSGSRIDLVRFFLLFDKPGGIFNIVTP
ncbi:MAG: alkyl sulfatase dimerization domain-containing protein [Desulfosalsimonadaceae bacterium]